MMKTILQVSGNKFIPSHKRSCGTICRVHGKQGQLVIA